jgi:aldose 1-epimerase
MTVLPTGEQYDLTRGDQRATVVELGGGLRRYRAGDRDLLDGYGADEPVTWVRGQVLAPWPNRLRDGRYTWDGDEHLLPLSEPPRGNAIHGLVRFAPWRPVARADDAVVLEHVLYPQDGYPFTLRLRIGYELTADGLRVTTTATNEGAVDLPYGEGHHPYLSAGPGLRVDDCTLVAPGATRLLTDDRSIPVGAEAVDGTPYDLRSGVRLGGLTLDSAFTDLRRDADGRAQVRLTGPDGRGVLLWADEGYPYLQLFTGDPIAEPRRRRGRAVEPMTCPPDALRSGRSVVRLAPGASTTASWGLAPIG